MHLGKVHDDPPPIGNIEYRLSLRMDPDATTIPNPIDLFQRSSFRKIVVLDHDHIHDDHDDHVDHDDHDDHNHHHGLKPDLPGDDIVWADIPNHVNKGTYVIFKSGIPTSINGVLRVEAKYFITDLTDEVQAKRFKESLRGINIDKFKFVLKQIYQKEIECSNTAISIAENILENYDSATS